MFLRVHLATLVAVAILAVACGGEYPSSGADRTLGASAQDPGVGANAESPGIDFATVTIAVGDNAAAPGTTGSDSGGVGLCPQGDFTCLCNLLYDLAASCGEAPDEPRSICTDPELGQEVYEECAEADLNQSQCWGFVDGFIRQCLATSCDNFCGFRNDIVRHPEPGPDRGPN